MVMFQKTHVLYNRETKGLISIGTESEMRGMADQWNERYQTDAFVAQEFKGE